MSMSEPLSPPLAQGPRNRMRRKAAKRLATNHPDNRVMDRQAADAVQQENERLEKLINAIRQQG